MRLRSHCATDHAPPVAHLALTLRRASGPLIALALAAAIDLHRPPTSAHVSTDPSAPTTARVDAARTTQYWPSDPPPAVHDRVAYAAARGALAVERWDLAAHAALPPLASPEPIISLAASRHGVFAVTDRTAQIERWPIEGGAARPFIALAEHQVFGAQIATLADHLIVVDRASVLTFDARSGALVDRTALPGDYVYAFSIAVDVRALFFLMFGTDNGMRLGRLDIAADGRLAAPRLGEPGASAGALFVRPDGQRAYDAHGIAYDGQTLGPVATIGRWPEAVVFDGENLYTTMGTRAYRWAADGRPSAFVALPFKPFGLALESGSLFAFGRRTDTESRGPLIVTRVATDALQAYLAWAADPSAAPFAPDFVAVGADGDLVVCSRARRGVFRWSVDDRRWRSGFALSNAAPETTDAPSPTGFAYDPGSDRLYVGYADGGIDRMDLAGPAAGVALPFAFDGSGAGIATAGEWLVLTGTPSLGDDLPWLFAPDGRGVGIRRQAPAVDQNAMAVTWDRANQRLVRLRDGSPRSIQLVTWDRQRGPVTATLALDGSGLDVEAGLYLSPGGETLVTGSGLVLSDAHLTTFDHLSSPVSAAAWPAGQLVTARSIFGHSEIVVWGTDLRPTAKAFVGGDIAALAARSGTLLAISRWNGATVVSEWRVDGGLEPIWSGQPPPPANDAPDTAQPFDLGYPDTIVTADTHGASRGPGEPAASCGGADQRPVWFTVETSFQQRGIVDLAGSTFAASVSVWRQDERGALIEVACANSGADGTARLVTTDTMFGRYWIAVSGQGHSDGRIVLSLDEAPSPEIEASIVAEDMDSLWFARVAPPRLERWGFATADWLPPTPLPVPVSHLAAGSRGLWLAAGRRLLFLDKGDATVRLVRAFNRPMVDIAAAGSGVAVLSGGALWHLDGNGEPSGWRRIDAPSAIERVDAAPAQIWVPSSGVLRRWPLLADGRVAARPVAPNRNIEDRSATQRSTGAVLGGADRIRFVNEHGTVIDAADLKDRYRLEPLPYFARRPWPKDDGGWHAALDVDGTWVGALGSGLAAWDGAGTMTGWRALPRPAAHLTRRGDMLFAALTYSRGWGTDEEPLEVLRIPLARLGVLSNRVPDDPGAVRWSPNLVAVSGDVAWLGSTDLQAVRRWSIADRRWLPGVPLPDTPIRLAADDRSLWVWLANGSLLSGAVGADTLTPVARLATASCGLVAVDGSAFVCEMSSLWPPLDASWVVEHLRSKSWSILAPDGRVLSRQDVPAATATDTRTGVNGWGEWAWHPPSRRLLFSLQQHAFALTVTPGGALGSLVKSDDDEWLGGPRFLWVNATADDGVTSDGIRFRPSDLTLTARLSVAPVAAAWLGEQLWSAGAPPTDGPQAVTSINVVRRDGETEEGGQLAGRVAVLAPLAGRMLAIGGVHRPTATSDSFDPQHRYDAPLLAEIAENAGHATVFRLPVAPANDRMATAWTLNVRPSDPVTVNTVAADADGDGPVPSCAPSARRGVWFWVDTYADSQAILLDGTDFRAVVTAFPVNDGVPGPEYACAAAPSQVVLDAGQDRRYLVRVSNGDAGGTLRIRTVPVPPRNDRRADATIIATLPYTTTAALGQATREWDRDLGCAGPVLVDAWWRFTAPAPMELQATLTQPAGRMALAAWRGAEASEGAGCVRGWEQHRVALRLDLAAGESVWLQVFGTGTGDPLALDVRTIPTARTSDDLDYATSIAGVPSSFDVSTEDATTEPLERMPSCGTTAGHSVWWRLASPPAPTAVRVDVVAADFDTVLSVWRGARHPLDEVACNDDSSVEDSRATLTLPVTPGEPVWVKLEGTADSGGLATVRFAGVPGRPRLWLPWLEVHHR